MPDDKPQPAPQDDTLLTMQELMAMLKMSRTKIWAMIQNDELPTYKIGGDYRFRRSEIDRWLERFLLPNQKEQPSQQDSTTTPNTQRNKK